MRGLERVATDRPSYRGDRLPRGGTFYEPEFSVLVNRRKHSALHGGLRAGGRQRRFAYSGLDRFERDLILRTDVEGCCMSWLEEHSAQAADLQLDWHVFGVAVATRRLGLLVDWLIAPRSASAKASMSTLNKVVA